MKRSKAIEKLNHFFDLAAGRKYPEGIDSAGAWIMQFLESNLEMRPPEWTEHNRGRGAGGAWAARRRQDWEPEDD